MSFISIKSEPSFELGTPFTHTNQEGIFTIGSYTDSQQPKAIKKQLAILSQMPFLQFSVGNDFVTNKGGMTFIQLQLGNSSRYVHLKSTGSLEGDELTILTGTCMFDKWATKFVYGDKEESYIGQASFEMTKPGSLHIDHKPTPYEIETSARLTSYLKSIVRQATLHKFKLKIHVPEVEYFTYLFEGFNRELVTEDQLQYWISSVSKKNSVMKSYFLRMMSPYQDNLNIEFVNNFNKDAILSFMHCHKRAPTPQELLEFSNGLWESSNGESYVDINHASYAHPLTQALNNGPAILLDDFTEYKIYDLVKAKRPEATNLGAVLTLPQVFYNNSETADMYAYRNPTPEVYKTILNHYEQ